MKKKTVYIGLSADSIHHGHINLIEKARNYGNVIIGLLTDKALINYKGLPLLSYEQRKKIVINLKGVFNGTLASARSSFKAVLDKSNIPNPE